MNKLSLIFVLIFVIFKIQCGNYPIVLLHGMLANCEDDDIQDMVHYFKKYTKQHVECVEVGNGYWDSVEMKFELQAQLACEALKYNSKFKGDISVVGISTGAMIGRYLIEKCDFPGKVRKYISIGGPQQGTAKLPNCKKDNLYCKIKNLVYQQLVYSEQMDSHPLGQALFRIPGKYNKYVKKSHFLSDLNNQKEYHEEYKTRMLQLEKMMLVLFRQDQVLFPKESAHFGFYNDKKTSKVIPMEETQLYIQDLIGLKELNKQKKIVMVKLGGIHQEFGKKEIKETFAPFLKE